MHIIHASYWCMLSDKQQFLHATVFLYGLNTCMHALTNESDELYRFRYAHCPTHNKKHEHKCSLIYKKSILDIYR